MENKINIACFKEGSRTAEVRGIWQWDYGQILRIQGLNLPSAVEIHFSLDEHGGEAARRIGITKDGVTDVPIPDLMVENESAYGDSYYFFAYIYLTDETSGNTEYKIRAKVSTRSRPEGYVSGGNDTFAEILKTVNEIAEDKVDVPVPAKVGQVLSVKATDESGKPTEFEATDQGGGVSDEKIAKAVGTYMKSNPVQAGATTEQAEQIQKNTEDISQLSEDNTALDNRVKILEQGGTNEGTVVSSIEPTIDDIPKVFFVGTAPTSKAEDELPLTMEYRSKTKTIKSYVTLKVQGDSSAKYAKKNFNLKMFSDDARTQKLKCTFRNWSNTHKYCLKANWIDHTHARNVVGGRLWNQIAKSRSDYESYPTEYKESANSGAVDGFPIKVYINGVYQGLYTWNIRKDSSMFNMDDETGTHSALIADANSRVTVWRVLPNINGSDWTDELNDTVPDAVKTAFQNAYSFVMNSTDEEFVANIENHFYLSSLIDYYIYIYCILMYGGLAKSQTMFTYDAQRFLANIYDMDTTWALYWDGSTFYDYETPCPSGYSAEKEVGQSNLLYERLVTLFPDKIKERYEELRSDILSDANIINEFERFMDVIPSDLYEEDYASTTGSGAFTGIPSRTTNTLQKLREIIVARMAYCDTQIPLLVPNPATGITLNQYTLIFTEAVAQTLTATVEPSDSTDAVVWESSDASIVTVADGVVTPISSGSATITATAGNYSATCEVTVDVPVIVVYTITRNLTKCVSSSNVTTLNEGSSHSETLTASDGYVLGDISVTMGGTDISANCVDGVLTISEVTGDIVINATGVEDVEKSALYPLANGTYSNDIATVVITNGNHVKCTRHNANAQVFFNISDVESNTDFTSTSLSHDKWFSLSAGQTGVYTISNIVNDSGIIVSTNFKKSNTTTSGSFGIANYTGTDEKSVSATVNADVDYGCLFVLVNGANNIENVVVEFDVSFMVDSVRYI